MLRALEEKLTILGLSPKESTVYLALLQGGEVTADQLAKLSKLNRSTTYVQIKCLIEKGLVTVFKRGKKTFYAAESPKNLERIIAKREEEIQLQKTQVTQLVPDLIRIFGNTVERPSVRVFEGKEGLNSMRNEILEQKPKDIYIMTSFDKMMQIYTHEELMAFTAKREKYALNVHVIYSLENGEDFKPFKLQYLKRVQPGSFVIKSDLYIYNDSVSFASVGESIVGLTIVNKAIADSMRSLFQHTWSTL